MVCVKEYFPDSITSHSWLGELTLRIVLSLLVPSPKVYGCPGCPAVLLSCHVDLWGASEIIS